MPIKVGLLGFGRTGKFVASEIIKDEDCSLEWVIRRGTSEPDSSASPQLGEKKSEVPFFSASEVDEDFFAKYPVDALIDFSSQEGMNVYDHAARSNVRIVSAISNYSEDCKKKLKKIATKTAVLHSPNITLGINWLMVASKVLKQIIPEADVEIVEEHFRGKADKSGTAIKIAEKLGLDASLHVNSVRVGGIVGKHEIIFGLPNQTIRLVHESINRAAFGKGAIFATKWIHDKDSGLYSMEQIIQEKFLHNLRGFGV
jgi:4-hydroxy-tetrahydrodipicolinate reductase